MDGNSTQKTLTASDKVHLIKTGGLQDTYADPPEFTFQ
jgi:hypothetical protein